MFNELERTIRRAAYVLADHDVARIWKWPEGFEKTGCDFFGYTRTARVILIEAKQVARASLPIGKSPGLAAHQWVALSECDRAGGIALICWQRAGEIAVIDYAIARQLSKLRRSIPWKEIDERFRKVDPCPSALLEPFVRTQRNEP